MTIKSSRWFQGNDALSVAKDLTAFVKAAQKTLHIAIYDFRLQGSEKKLVVGAIKAAAARGVDVRIAFDHTRATSSTKDKSTLGNDPAPRGTLEFVESEFPASTKVRTRAIAGSHLMHDKYVIRDGSTKEATVWTGSANFTNDAWSKQENNVVVIRSPALVQHYEADFAELWSSEDIKGTGVNDYGTVNVGATKVEFAFSPGEGAAVASLFVDAIHGAGPDGVVRVASMVLSSGAILGALHDHLEAGGKLVGAYDETQMKAIEKDWQPKGKPASPKLALWNAVKPHLVGKHSTPYTPTSPHDFMHDKVLVTDHVLLTGSFNLSENAESNAENALAIHDVPLAKEYAKYIDQIIELYGPKHFKPIRSAALRRRGGR